MTKSQEIAPPPQVPKNLAEIDRAVMLLGSLANADKLKQSRQAELRTLLGAVPQAKTALKRVREEYA